MENSILVRFGVKLDDLTAGLDSAKSAVKRDTEAMRDAMDNAGKGGASAMASAFSGIGATVRSTMEGAGGDIGKLGSTATKVAGDMTRGFSALPGVLGAVGTAALALGAAVVGLLALKGAADAAAEYTEEAMKLGRGMAVSATTASVWMAAMADVGASTGELQAASSGLTRKLKENEDDMNRLGLVTRGANGDLLGMDTIMRNAISTVNSYKEGTDRNMAAQAIFGRGVAGNSKLLLANTEVMEQNEAYMRQLGGTVGVESVQAWEAYDSAMDRVSLGMTALRNTIGNAVMPVLGKLGSWLSDILPAAVTVVRGALGGLMASFWLVKNGVVVVWETINAMVTTVAEPIRALAEAIYLVMKGDFAGAKSALADIGKNISAAWGTAMDEMVKSSEESSTRIIALFNNTDSAGPDGKGNKYTAAPDAPKKEKAEKVTKEKAEKAEPAEKSKMGEWEEANTAAKAYYELTNSLRVRDLSEDVDYWNARAEEAGQGTADATRSLAKASAAKLAMLKKDGADGRAMSEEVVAEAERAALSAIELARQRSAADIALGSMTVEQRIEQERGFEAERFNILVMAQTARIAMAEQDPNSAPGALMREKNKMLEVERAYELKKGVLLQQSRIEQDKFAQSFKGSMESSFAGILKTFATGTMTIRSLFRSMGKAILDSMIDVFAKIAAKWAATQIANLVMSKTTTAAAISGEAAKAGAGGVASMAAAPFPLNMTAPVFGAAMATLAGSFGVVASAAGGFDIPAGMNPITQLHQREMVLPAEHADTIRGLSAGGGGGVDTLHWHGTPDDTIKAKDLARVLKKMHRNFQFV